MKVPRTIVVLVLLGGCRSGAGEACAQDGDCQEELACHEKTCKTRQQIAQITMQRREAEWREAKQEIFGQVVDLQERLGILERKLAEAETEQDRERIRRQLEALRKVKGADAGDVPVTPPAAAPR